MNKTLVKVKSIKTDDRQLLSCIKLLSFSAKRAFSNGELIYLSLLPQGYLANL